MRTVIAILSLVMALPVQAEVCWSESVSGAFRDRNIDLAKSVSSKNLDESAKTWLLKCEEQGGKGRFKVMTTEVCRKFRNYFHCQATGKVVCGPINSPYSIKQLHFLLGHWEGKGWIEMKPGERKVVEGKEVLKLSAGVLTREGLHGILPSFSVIFLPEERTHFVVSRFLNGEKALEEKAFVTENTFTWTEKDTLSETIYTQKVVVDGNDWTQIGTVKTPNDPERVFMELNLHR